IAKTLGMSRDRTRRLEREGLALMRTSSFELEAYMAV
ncbi:MAG: RNA polymerase sigma factor, RpoD/SigA family, partial [Prochlorococcus sp. ALOHA_A2.0_51]|nr:RNA polymerase sigma factor, RpoD/SigA family [Prochlorococcus sp. ALOHA_A2.0_51]